MSNTKLKFVPPLQSFIDTTFFQELSHIKLDITQLDSTGIDLYTKIDTLSTPRSSNSSHLFLNKQSFDKKNWENVENGIPLAGKIFNFNAIDEFKKLDKIKFLEERTKDLWVEGELDINKCIGFSIISFADLKKYKFYYWVCTPCFSPSSLQIEIKRDNLQIGNIINIKTWLSNHMTQWVCLVRKDNSIVEYSKEEANDCKVLCLRDLSNMENVPSSVTKNLLSIFKHHCPTRDTIQVCFIRSDDKTFGLELSILQDSMIDNIGNLKVSGWERNIQGKLSPRMMDLSLLIDPLKIAEQSVDLNLKLMKWRVAPDIDLEIIKNTKVLILGSGTLGCYVSRALMAWGVRKITLVDNGTVSYSNPVRQPLFEFEDCGKPKAETAAKSLKRIFPLLDVMGITLNIPMIGHTVTNEEREKEEFLKLVKLFEEHDAIFLLMDSRETRWLPTVLGNIHNKIVLNAALGFDTYLVMRHGNYYGQSGNQLGCYFCQDVVVPIDSLTDKTLDQMCTVTRPGVAMLAASQVSELFISILQNDKKADVSTKEENVLGEVPHQIRGFLHSFSSVKLETPAYNHCSACSSNIIEACETYGWEFVKRSLNDPEYIENLSGLKDVKKEIDKLTENMDDWAIDDDDVDDVEI